MDFRTPLSAMTLALMAAGLSANALAVGKLEGNVRDQNTRQPLPGASVTIKELNLSQQVGRDGRFFFVGLNDGEYTLQVSYLGAAPSQQSIRVDDDRTTQVELVLAPRGVEHIRVVGQQGALSQSMNRQRGADNLLSVVSADVLGNFPDSNISESLQRVPGLSIERDQGEGRFVRVRGMAPDYNSVSMNGVRLPSPESDRRAVALDVVPSDLLQSVEVSKTLTPDMDADALGGAIEVKSLSAFDRDDTYLNLSAEVSQDTLTNNTNPKLAVSYSDIFAENLGIALGVSWYDRDFGSDNVETGGKWTFVDTLDKDKLGYGDAALSSIDQRAYQINRERLGIGINFDYHPSDDTDLYLRSLYSEFDDTETRNSAKTKWKSPQQAEVLSKGKTTRSLKSRRENQNITSIVAGGESRFALWTLDYQASHSTASAEKPRNLAGADFVAKLDDTGFRDSHKPKVIAPASYYRVDAFELDEIEIATAQAKDTLNSVQFDLSRQLSLGAYPVAVKTGAKVSRRDKSNRADVWIYGDLRDQGVTDEALSLGQYSGGDVDYSLERFGPGIEAAPLWDVIESLDADVNRDAIESSINDFDIREKVNAAYLMGHIDIDKMRILTGLRFEQNEWDSRGHGFDGISGEFADVDNQSDENHWLPALHLTYRHSDTTVLRAAWTNTLVRPTFGQLAPGYLKEEGDGDIDLSFGNPHLASLESMNLDLSLEHYFGNIGLLSAGLFYKDIDNFIYQADLAGRGDYVDAHSAVTFVNGDSAHIYGVELSYVQEFSFLPEPLNALVLNSNLTYTDSAASISWNDGDLVLKRDIPMPSQSDITANLSLGYEDSYASVWLSAAYKSEYLQEVTELNDERHDLYTDTHLQWDLVAKAHLTTRLSLYFKGVNLTDEPYYSYTGNPDYNAQYETYGRTFQLGIQYVNY
ncbi:TonB-dependent receptor [Shewanella salipaludis]|uniref:TonB-dependent receptor n=1 Tax=Shewanella salipaludis TaxID=2723052 RepID=A0A972JLF0_9GAMM|nr:TonB-dependent receptor [Shewanella salipaludis]NMH64011.1 TonB-dependent receptor [Shewanella salipaludis]